MVKTLKYLGIKVVTHALFWCLVFLFFKYFFDVNSTNEDDALVFAIFLMPITIATTYVSIYVLIPEYLIKKRYGYFVLYSSYTLIISLYLIMLSIFFSLTFLADFDYKEMNPMTRNLILVTTAVYAITIMASAFKLLKLNLEQSEKSKELQTKMLNTQLKLKEQELNYLKMQIQPHFLFNTLNTMYGFALKKAEETPEMILKLSNLLDYLLYEVDKPFVPLIKEVQHIQDYIALEYLRFSDRLNIEFEIDEFPEQTEIAPMILLPFIENSFKHGSIKNGTLNISIALKVDEHKILFNVSNTANSTSKDNQGIGLKNVKKRLDLLYSNKHDLTIFEENNEFKIALKLFTNE
ncbi:MAG: sensor histidine kinase [bacterium]